MRYLKRLAALFLLLALLCPVAAMAEHVTDDDLLRFYDDCAFFGDSRMEAFRRYRSFVHQTDEDFLSKTDIICRSSMSLYAGSRQYLSGDYYFSYNFVDDTMYAIAEKIRPRRIFILLGLNDEVATKIEKGMSWVEDIIRNMQNYSPDSELYFFSETPVTPKYCKEKDLPGYQEKVDEYNRALKETCEKNGANYVELAEMLKGEDGYLNPEYASDGMCHLNDEGIQVWIQCLKDYAREQAGAGKRESLQERVMNVAEDSDSLIRMSGDDLSDLIGIGPEDYTGFVYLADKDALSGRELIVLRAADEDAAERVARQLERYREQRLKETRNYLPEAYRRVDASEVKQNGLTVVLSIAAPNPEEADLLLQEE